jgi:HNH endonuclease
MIIRDLFRMKKGFSRAADRFWKYVKKENNCWLWTGATAKGYGDLQVGDKRQRAHRISWMLHRGKIPKGMFVCHKCDNPPCVNPAHLFLGTNRDNILDCHLKGRNIGVKMAAIAKRQIKHCPRNHQYDVENTRYTKDGHRKCRKCDRLAHHLKSTR